VTSKNYFVTRHPGAAAWAQEQCLVVESVQANFDVNVIQPGDVVIGTLPVQLVAEVNRRGGHYWHLSMTVPETARGTDLSAEQMRAFGARLEEFHVMPLGQRTSVPHLPNSSADRPLIHVCIASGQALASAIPIANLPWTKVILCHSKGREAEAELLKNFIEEVARKRGMGTAGQECCELRVMPSLLTWETLIPFAAGLAGELAQTDPACSVDVNVTGGLKIMSLAFDYAFRSHARVLYCNTEVRQIEVVSPAGSSPIPLESSKSLNLWQHLAVQGFAPIKPAVPPAGSYFSLDEIKRRQCLTSSLIFSVPARRPVPQRRVQIETGPNPDHMQQPGWQPTSLMGALHAAGVASVLKPYTFHPWVRLSSAPASWFDPLTTLQTYGLISNLTPKPDAEPAPTTFEFRWHSKEAASYCGGTYLEEYAFLSAHCLINLPLDNYGSQIEIRPRNAFAPTAMNELDAAVLWNDRLIIIECKAGRQVAGGKDQEVLNRLDSLRDNAGGSHALGWLLSIDEFKGPAYLHVVDRAKANNLALHDGLAKVKCFPDSLATALTASVDESMRPPITVLPSFSGTDL
jgi:putative CRISPR-associated protein (TIGR02620 family)